MQQAVVRVFEEYLSDTTPSGGTYRITTYTSIEHTDLLSSADQIAIQAVVNVLSSVGHLPVTIAIEHSANGRTWKRKNKDAEIAAMLDVSRGSKVITGGEPWPCRPRLRHSRLRIDIGDGLGPFSVQLAVDVSTRTRAQELPRVAPLPSPLPPLKFARVMAVLGIQRQTILELERLAGAESHGSAEERYAAIVQGLNAPAKADLLRFVRALRSLDARSKQHLIGAANGLVKLLSLPAAGSFEPEDDLRATR